MLQTSGDILNIVIAVSVALLVLFVCWGLFYLVMTVRNLYKISKEAREGFSKVSEILGRLKEQVDTGTFYLSLIKEGIEKGVNFLRKKTGGKKKTASDKKTNPSKKTKTAKNTTKKATASSKKTTKKK